MKSAGLAVCALVLVLASCRYPLQELLLSSRPSATGAITVSVSVGSAGRTVVPDYVSQVDAVEVNLVSNDGYAPLSGTATAAPWQVTFTDVRTGSWNIEVVARKAGEQVGSGSAETTTLSPGESVTVPVTVSFSPTGSTGEVSFTVSFPASTNVDSVYGTISAAGLHSTPPVEENGSMRSATLSFTGLATGTHDLTLIFYRGGLAVRAGYFLEQVVVTAGFTSGSWVATDGSLVAERTFAETDFFSDNALLGGLTIYGVVWRGFDPINTDYTLGPTEASTVTFQAATSLPGQYLQYRWNGSALAEIVPDTESPTLVLVDDPAVLLTDNTLEVVVTAPDRETTTTYTIRLSKCYTVGYSSVGTTGGLPPVDPNLYEAGQTVTVLGNPGDLTYVPSYAFTGWMAEGDPIFYAVGSFYTMPANPVVFDSQWDRWTRLAGGPGAIMSSNDIAVDSDGSSYVVGTTSVALDGQTLNGVRDAFITKYNTAGTKQWTKLLGAEGAYTYGTAISIDSVSGDCYMTGYTNASLDGQPLTGSADVFVARYTLDGTWVWTRLSGVPGKSTRGYGICTRPAGGCCVTGQTDGNLDGCLLIGTSDTFVIKYDSDGDKIWTQLAGVAGSSMPGQDISVAGDDTCYLVGSAEGGLVGQSPFGLVDAFVIKYEMGGMKMWSVLSGVYGVYTYGSGIVLDSSGSCYVTGYTSGELDGQSRSGDYDAFVMKYNATSAAKLWTRLCGGTIGSITQGTGICVDPAGTCYVAGHSTGGFDGLPAIGQEDTFVISYDLAGGKQWSRLSGVAGAVTEGTGIAIDPSMNTYVTGHTTGALDGQPLTGTQDAFVTTRLNP